MKVKGYFCFVLLFMSFGFTTQVNSIIIPYKGVDEFIIEETTYGEVNKQDDIKKSRSWERGEVLQIGSIVKKIYLRNRDIELIFKKEKRFGKYYLASIYLHENYKGKTTKNVGIGSTYEDIVNEFGNAVINNYEDISVINFYNPPIKENEKLYPMSFACKNPKADSTNFRVDRILIKNFSAGL